MKFVNHIDHVTWVSKSENIEGHVEKFSRLFDVEFGPPSIRHDMGFTIYLSWEAGLEIVCPHDTVTDFNRNLHDRLASHGEGMMAIVFGVRNLEQARERLEASGFEVGPLWGKNPDAPWSGKVDVKERGVGTHMNTWMIFGEIEYADSVVTVE